MTNFQTHLMYLSFTKYTKMGEKESDGKEREQLQEGEKPTRTARTKCVRGGQRGVRGGAHTPFSPKVYNVILHGIFHRACSKKSHRITHHIIALHRRFEWREIEGTSSRRSNRALRTLAEVRPVIMTRSPALHPDTQTYT
jgi:hypothetical protein